ncbi:hypothetical protein [Caldanaerobius polysaccharolyticus]|uniref:hypothetical protein n=1 Tax=Caldanaerobius polysaccharolyticus TaxID=44256 RepID=UPI00047C32B2|nr:hypothetical protein [Caldanaerobius polysaccharolyticus]
MNFKDVIHSDLDVFFNLDEFAESHIIDGRSLKIVIDNDRLQQRTQKEYDGIYVGDILYYVSSADYGPAPKIDEIQIFDDQQMQVFDVREEAGIYEIILRRNLGG